MSIKTRNKPTTNSTNKKTTFRKNVLTLAVVQALALSSTVLYAANITINSGADNVTEDGLCTLREAIAAANTDTGVDCTAGNGIDTITFDNNLSASPITLAGSQLLVTSDLTIDGDLDNDGTPDITINANNSSRVIQVGIDSGPGSIGVNVTLDGLTMTGGNSDNSGGGIYLNEYSNLIVSNSIISGNTSSNRGGGIFARYSNNITITDSTLSDNTALFGGGAVFSENSTLYLTNSTLSGNITSDSTGGAIHATSGGNITVTNSTLSGNTAQYGGGAITTIDDTDLTLTNSTLSGNTTLDGTGGAIFIAGKYANTNITNSTLAGNTAQYGGGAIFMGSDTNLNLTNSTLSGNTALNGSGGGISAGKYTNTNIINSTLSGNTAQTSGGAIIVDTAILNIRNSSIINNGTNYYGGGIHGRDSGDPATINIINSILANNTNGDCNSDSAVTTNTNNLVEDGGAGCTMTPLLAESPQLGALADNGGPTQTHMPMVGSPVLDAASNADCTTTDQRSEARGDGSCDIGAVEGTTSTVLTNIQFDNSTATVSEDGTSITLNLTRSGGISNEISVVYTTSDGTATAPADYTTGMNTLNFAVGVTSQSITIDITDDTDVENDENFSVTLSDAQSVSGWGIVEIGDNASTTVTITDDDTAPATGTDPDTNPGTNPTTAASSNALSLNPWWMLSGFIGLLRRKFKS